MAQCTPQSKKEVHYPINGLLQWLIISYTIYREFLKAHKNKALVIQKVPLTMNFQSIGIGNLYHSASEKMMFVRIKIT